MEHFSYVLGGLFACIAVLFLLGLLKPFARHFYPGPTAPGVIARAAAPVIFACLAAACFQGAGLPVLIVVAVAGSLMIARNRRRRDRRRAV